MGVVKHMSEQYGLKSIFELSNYKFVIESYQRDIDGRTNK